MLITGLKNQKWPPKLIMWVLNRIGRKKRNQRLSTSVVLCGPASQLVTKNPPDRVVMQGLRPKQKELQNYLLENQIDILALSETFLKPNSNFTFQVMTCTKMTD